jgi:hypothetical protein
LGWGNSDGHRRASLLGQLQLGKSIESINHYICTDYLLPFKYM